MTVLAGTMNSGVEARSSGSAFPTPPQGATVYSRELGSYALALAVVPGRGSVRLEADIVSPEGLGARGFAVSFHVNGSTKRAVMRSAGRYSTVFAVGHRPASVDVVVAGRAHASWHVDLPLAWPPRDAQAIVARAGKVWRSLRSLRFRETLASNPTNTLVSEWRLQAPDRLAYQIKDGPAGVVIGGRRWDRDANAKHWQSSSQTRLRQPIPSWVSTSDAHLLGTGMVRGNRVLRVTFFDQLALSWFEIVVEKKTFRTLESRMVATAHFMDDTYRSFNSTPSIVPPKG